MLRILMAALAACLLASPALAQTPFTDGMTQASKTPANATLALNPAGAVVSIGAANVGGLTLAPYTIANLPSCVAGIAGDMVYISNGVASPTRGATVSTTGATGTYVVCNGSNWTY